ncbi:hypothetical protein OHR86_00065 [Streptomyces sp. NBC_00441]|uniref:hypothetical protein n=1 Tax=Streptomyces sp. NBC_00441 TaxID=2975742 RepID=UPI002E2E1355|nr:hypothetical protein [Streptomyces sp. NBC_00441]
MPADRDSTSDSKERLRRHSWRASRGYAHVLAQMTEDQDGRADSGYGKDVLRDRRPALGIRGREAACLDNTWACWGVAR